MLSAVREGKLADSHREEFRKLARPCHYDDGIEPTQLYVTRFCFESLALLDTIASH